MKKWKAAVTAVLMSVLVAGMPVFAEKQVMSDGGVFDAEYYTEKNPDVVAVLGTDPNVLYEHYKNYGAAEGRQPYAVAQPYETQLSAGHYVVGKDIPVGTYNITWVSGNGNVMGGSYWDGGINEVFGTRSSFAVTSYANVVLNEGESLTITSDLTVDIASAAAEVEDMTGRQLVDGMQTITLSSGNYVAGSNFPAGTYTIQALSGRSGNVYSDTFCSDGGINEVMGVGDSRYAITTYKNVILSTGETLTVSGITVELIPVGE